MCEHCLDMFGLWCLKDIEDAEYLLQLEPPVEYICVRAPLIWGHSLAWCFFGMKTGAVGWNAVSYNVFQLQLLLISKYWNL